MKYTLMNFNIPTHLKRNLDLLAKYKHVSRTSILNSLLELYCKQELKSLEDSKRIQDLIRDQLEPVTSIKRVQEYEQPVNIMFDEDYDWEERFKS